MDARNSAALMQYITPFLVLGEMLHDKNAEKSKTVMKAMLQMDKIDIKKLKQAYDQG